MRIHGHAHAVEAQNVENKPWKKRDLRDVSRLASQYGVLVICKSGAPPLRPFAPPNLLTLQIVLLVSLAGRFHQLLAHE